MSKSGTMEASQDYRKGFPTWEPKMPTAPFCDCSWPVVLGCDRARTWGLCAVISSYTYRIPAGVRSRTAACGGNRVQLVGVPSREVSLVTVVDNGHRYMQI